jgi:transposase-like protein
MTHRIREAMRTGVLAPMGGNGGVVEADETFIGREPGKVKKAGGYQHKMKVLSLVDRQSKQVRSMVVDDLKTSTLLPILRENIAKETRLMTDEAWHYHRAKHDFASHETVNHNADEYVRGDVTTNTVENYFSVFKRGMLGTYQHCGKDHLHRYLAEFDFRYNNRSALGVDDVQRTMNAMVGIEGKRLTYRRPDQA